ncbi:MAG: hypothetical protein KC609_07665 [Myxococcales bacterium]|nr:hypothetical protein [Myxococcales bacterium]
MRDEEKVLLCKLVIKAVAADHEIQGEEADLVDRVLLHYGMADKRLELLKSVNDPLEPLLAELAESQSPEEIVAAAALAVGIDGEIADREMVLLERLADVIGMDDEEFSRVIDEALAS